MGTKGKGQTDPLKNLANTSRIGADASLVTASQPDEIEAMRRKHAMDLWRWQQGESGPIDVRNMPGGGVDIALFNDALKVNDANRVGRGVGSMSGTANPNFVAALNKENEMERHKFASGALEGNVNDALAANNAEMTGLYQTANARNMGIAGMREGRYESDQDRYLRYLMSREARPSFLRTLSQSFAGALGNTLGGGNVSMAIPPP
jgi:hypothetical protein